MTIQKIKTSDLRQAEYNPRIMPEEEAEALKRSIETFGLVEPVIVNSHICQTCGDRSNILIGGHQRLAAVRDNPDYQEVPAVLLDLHEPQEMQLNIALNKIGGAFDTVKLKSLVREIKATTPDLTTVTGFNPGEIANILAPVEMPGPDAWTKVPDGDQPDYTTMSFTVSNQQAAEILKAIHKTREKHNVPAGTTDEQTIGAALVAMAADYLQKNGLRD